MQITVQAPGLPAFHPRAMNPPNRMPLGDQFIAIEIAALSTLEPRSATFRAPLIGRDNIGIHSRGIVLDRGDAPRG
jgi:hypothetical protein